MLNASCTNGLWASNSQTWMMLGFAVVLMILSSLFIHEVQYRPSASFREGVKITTIVVLVAAVLFIILFFILLCVPKSKWGTLGNKLATSNQAFAR